MKLKPFFLSLLNTNISVNICIFKLKFSLHDRKPTWGLVGFIWASGAHLPHFTPIWVPHLKPSILLKYNYCLCVFIIPNSLSFVLKTYENEYLSEMWQEKKESLFYWVPSGSHLLFIKIDYFPINIYSSL